MSHPTCMGAGPFCESVERGWPKPPSRIRSASGDTGPRPGKPESGTLDFSQPHSKLLPYLATNETTDPPKSEQATGDPLAPAADAHVPIPDDSFAYPPGPH
ncbi:hypothetical protein HPB50_015010 [Hyalomma asiaticum]|uniref:Uncharacterized protein n=1 Tax=Hyalomma asiaticum TaxID=266040 RepID=A0ACB7T9X9_HYAAI|nr:hypothetical protein HPB50_015010 [Hyalomma asiaticum]